MDGVAPPSPAKRPRGRPRRAVPLLTVSVRLEPQEVAEIDRLCRGEPRQAVLRRAVLDWSWRARAGALGRSE